MNRWLLLVPMALLTGCNVHSKSPGSGDENVTINADESGNVAFNLPFVNGQVKLPSGFMSNGDFDIDGVKLMPGSKVSGLNVFAADKGSTVNITFTAPAPPDQVRSYFVDQFRKQGVEASLAGDVVTGKSKDGSPFSIQVAAAGTGSKGTIVVHDND
ncbi:MAG TPA: hypothetical protein VIV07_10935 [Sphingomicrobium sp.]